MPHPQPAARNNMDNVSCCTRHDQWHVHVHVHVDPGCTFISWIVVSRAGRSENGHTPPRHGVVHALFARVRPREPALQPVTACEGVSGGNWRQSTPVGDTTGGPVVSLPHPHPPTYAPCARVARTAGSLRASTQRVRALYEHGDPPNSVIRTFSSGDNEFDRRGVASRRIRYTYL